MIWSSMIPNSAVAVAATLIHAASEFHKRKGERKVGLFVDGLAGLSPIVGDGLNRFAFLAEEVYGDEYSANDLAARTALEALKCTDALLAHLRVVALAAIQDSVADLTTGRLINSTPFCKAVKPE